MKSSQRGRRRYSNFYKTMTTNEKRIKIAEACGTLSWSECNPPGVCLGNGVPDYFNDLNAMHEAEKVLDPNQQITFACHLTQPVRDQIYEVMPNDLHYAVCFPALHATAAQRAEAFGKTLNLW